MHTLAAFAGLFVCLYHLWWLINEDLAGRQGPRQTAIGKVVDFHTGVDDGRQTYVAVVQFESDSGSVQFVDDVWGSSQPRLGRSLKVRFPVDQPQLAQVYRPLLRAFAYALDTVFALAMVGILTGLLPSNMG